MRAAHRSGTGLAGVGLAAWGAWLAGCGSTPAAAPVDTTGGNQGDVTPLPDPSTTVSAACSAAAAASRDMVTGGSPFNTLFGPHLGPTTQQPVAPPAISGGTLRVLAGGQKVVAADSDRDLIYIVDAATMSLSTTIALAPGDEPGRVIEDGAGRVHVALRGGGALVTVDPAAGTVIARREVCTAPRGVAYQASGDLVHVACAGGELVSFPAGGGAAVRRLTLDRDLRDIVVEGERLRVSRFRSAELLTVDADGQVVARMTPPVFRTPSARGGQAFSPAVAWRTMEGPDGRVMMMHQRGVDDSVQPGKGGYGGFNSCHSITHPAVTMEKADGTVVSGPAIAGLVLPVDAAISPDGLRIAIVSPSNAHNSPGVGFPNAPLTLFVTDMESAMDRSAGCRPDGKHAPCGGRGGIPILPAAEDAETAEFPPGAGLMDEFVACETPFNPDATITDGSEPIAVAFLPNGRLLVQSREPAKLTLMAASSASPSVSLSLSLVSRADTGHTLFHANSGSGLACASCHAEGREDGRVWNITCEGPRRTQSLQTGLAGTEPFHWNGDETDFPHLVQDVFTGRMSGPMLDAMQSAAIFRWLDAQPRLRQAPGPDADAAARGHDLFLDTTRAACVTCHAGERLTNNQTVDVGTGGPFQVPSLVGISARAPFIHNGCAPTLRDRLTSACAGGDKHGVTSILSPAEISDLVAYLETL